MIGNELIDPWRLTGTPLGECYRAYREMLDRYHFLTFSLIISCALEALDEEPAIYERVHGPLRHLVVDEYQDINPCDARLPRPGSSAAHGWPLPSPPPSASGPD